MTLEAIKQSQVERTKHIHTAFIGIKVKSLANSLFMNLKYKSSYLKRWNGERKKKVVQLANY